MFRRNLLVLVVLCTSLVLGGCKKTEKPFECTDAIACVTLASDEPLKLGVLQALSGGAAPFGTDQLRGVELAVARRGDELLGHPIELLSEDTGCTPEGGGNAALTVVADPQLVGIVGTFCSSAATGAGEVMSKEGLVMISGANGAPSLTAMGGEQGADWQPGYFRVSISSAAQVEAAAVFAFRELGVTRVATINDGGPVSKGGAAAFEQSFIALGGEIVLSAAINSGDTDMEPVLASVASFEPELIMFPIFPPEGAHIVRQAKKMASLENTVLLGMSVLLTEEFIAEVGEDGVGLYFVDFAPPQGAAIDALHADYQARYGEDFTTPVEQAFDAANLLLDTIEAVAVPDPKDDETIHIGRQALRDALYATVDYAGVTGNITCDEFGDCGTPKFDIVRLDDPSAGIAGIKSNVIYTYPSE